MLAFRESLALLSSSLRFLALAAACGLVWSGLTVVGFSPATVAGAADDAAQAKPAATANAGEVEFFERQVRPLLVQHCFSCHGKGQKKGGLSLDSRAAMMAGGESGPVIVADKPADSMLVKAVKYDGDVQMPPNGKLTDAEIAVLERWVASGAVWPESKTPAGGIRPTGSVTVEDRQFWSFTPPRPQAIPNVAAKHELATFIDSFVVSRLEQEGLKSTTVAGRRTLARRAAFDLLGLPLDAEQLDELMADEGPDAFARLVDRLLASPHLGERWSRHWLDVARYGEDQAHTFAARLYPQGYRYRDWVIESFNHDKPYDQFAIEQIAGDLLPSDAQEGKFARLPALGFFALGPVYYADAGCAPKAQADEWDDRIDTLTRGFLGLTVSCARCHDHKFDPVSMHDYYALAGIFASTRYDETPLVPADIVQAFNSATARVKDQEKAVNDTQTAEVRKLSESWVPQVANYLAAAWHVQNRRKVEANFAAAAVAKERQLHDFVLEAWLKLLTPEYVGQRPWLVEWKKLLDSQDAKVDLSGDESAVAAVRTVAEQIQSQAVAALMKRMQLDAEYDAAIAQAANEEAKKKVAKKQLEKADAELLKDLLTEGKSPFNTPKDRAEKLFDEAAKGRIAEAKSKLEQLKREVPPKYPFVHGLADGDAKNLKIHLRGNHTTLGDEAPRKFLAVLSPDNASPFSQGSGRLELAKSIGSDSNPLTARVFVNRVWQQMLGRGLVGTPSNFGLLGERPTHPELLDELAVRFMARGWSLKSLQREILLSSTWQRGSNRLDANDQKDPDNRLLWRMNRRRLDIEAWRDSLLSAVGNLDLSVGGPSSNLNDGKHRRRTLYASISRHDLNPMLRLFDFPDANLTSERRVVTTVPMQQLFVLNSDFVIRQAQAFAERVDREASSDPIRRVETAYRLLFGRSPTDKELAAGTRFLNETPADPAAKLSPWVQYTQALLATNEFTFVD